VRENRWVIVVSNRADCRDRYQETVVVVLLSAKTEYASRHDVFIRRPDGGLPRDSIAQTDLVFVVEKVELLPERHRGVVMADTLRQVRAKLSDTLGISPGS
jgi:mRNA-degrading endonuclease toxin of MazEF toxin-antitoxin module